ncbi:MAG: hypothetical protein FWF77_00765 [Defluviitaleaceae bacterium]|nr:hypothetical protein [Defluviitaleaceae bacterium]
MAVAAYALEAGYGFPARKKARQARGGHQGHVAVAAYALEAGYGSNEIFALQWREKSILR